MDNFLELNISFSENGDVNTGVYIDEDFVESHSGVSTIVNILTNLSKIDFSRSIEHNLAQNASQFQNQESIRKIIYGIQTINNIKSNTAMEPIISPMHVTRRGG